MPNKTTTVCAARTNALACNIHELITELEERIEDGESFDNPKLTRAADCVFDGTRAQGKYTPREAYDAVEIAVNNYLLEKHARELMQMDVSEALTLAVSSTSNHYSLTRSLLTTFYPPRFSPPQS